MKPIEIESVIEKNLQVTHLDVKNPRADGLHFEALVVSSDFEGKTLLERHRMVMDALKNHFQTVLHALSLKTLTPHEWKQNV